MLTRDELHRLVDALPDSELPIAARFLQARRDPVARTLMDADIDDEPLDADDIAAIEEGKADPVTLSWEKYLATRREQGST